MKVVYVQKHTVSSTAELQDVVWIVWALSTSVTVSRGGRPLLSLCPLGRRMSRSSRVGWVRQSQLTGNGTKTSLLFPRITKPKHGHPKHHGSILPRCPARCPAQLHRSMQSPVLAASGTTPCRCCSPLCGLQPVTAVPPPSPMFRHHHSPHLHQHIRRHPRASRPSLGRLSAGQPICPSTDHS